MVTINVAEHFRLDHLIGSLSPGKMADILMVPTPEEFSPQWVMCKGKVIFKEGNNMVEPKKVTFPKYLFDTVKVPDHVFSLIKGGALVEPTGALTKLGKARVMELVTNLVTKEAMIDLENPKEAKDVMMLLALDRVGRGGAFMGLLKGFGLQRGAYGTTMSWDTIDMFVVGCDMGSMKTVIERLKEMRGGGVYAIGDKVVSEFQAPLCGFYSLKPMEILSAEVKSLEECLKSNGVKWEKPALTVDTLGTPAIPHLRITHHGYVRLRDREMLSLMI
jgi:adenine deaminase